MQRWRELGSLGWCCWAANLNPSWDNAISRQLFVWDNKPSYLFRPIKSLLFMKISWYRMSRVNEHRNQWTSSSPVFTSPLEIQFYFSSFPWSIGLLAKMLTSIESSAEIQNNSYVFGNCFLPLNATSPELELTSFTSHPLAAHYVHNFLGQALLSGGWESGCHSRQFPVCELEAVEECGPVQQNL